MDEKLLISRVISGKKDLFEILVKKYYNPVYSRAFSLLLNYEDSEEIVQESFISAFVSLSSLRDRDKFAQWIGGIVRRKSIYFLRKKIKKRKNIEGLQADYATELMEKQNEERPEQERIGHEQKKILLNALFSLHEKYREVLYMRYFKNLSYREIGRFLGLTKSGVDTRLQRGRALLKKRLEAKGINYEL